MKISITTDSTSDIPEELVKQHNIHIMPLFVVLGENTFQDGVDIKPEDIYAYVSKTGTLPKTSTRNQIDYEEFFTKTMKEDNSEALIHISLSSGISSTHNNARLASLNMKNVYVIDSEALSTGCALLVLSCIDKINAGMPVEEIVKEIEDEKTRTNVSFVIDSLDYLHKGGRCSTLALLGANVLGIKPSIKMEDGILSVNKKYIGKIDNVTMKYVNDTLKANPNPIKKRVFITYTTENLPLIEKIKEVLQAKGFEQIYNNLAGCTITSHCGRGTLGILFINDK